MPPLAPDQLKEIAGTLKICQWKPPVQPPKRKVEMFRFKIEGIAVTCSNCKKKSGTYTCSGCMAVRFCSADCLKEFWPGHKGACNEIKATAQKCRENIEKINGDGSLNYANMMKMAYKGELDWNEKNDDEDDPLPKGFFTWKEDRLAAQSYLMSRQSLVRKYADLGRDVQSPLAFRLAAENTLDILCMTYKNAYGEKEFKDIGNWMTAAGMDQEALNFFVYLNTRRYSKGKLPYMDLDSMNADIEDPKTLDTLLGKNAHYHTAPFFPEHHIYLIGILLKYKKLQHNMMDRRKSVVKWKSFLMGTHPKIGKDSPIQKLRGNRTALEKIQNMVVSKELANKLKKEPAVITQYLKRMEMRSKTILPKLIDRHHEENVGWAKMLYGMPGLFGLKKMPSVRYIYDDAWRKSPAYHQILFKYMETGKITNKPWHEPMEGFHQASIDTDPSKDYDDCSEFSLMCLKTGSRSSVHICKS